MNTSEDFKNAPVGATATYKVTGGRAMKVDDGDQYWITLWGSHLSDVQMALCDYTLDTPAPTSVREALDLAWELAHPVKEGQVIPVGAWLVDRRYNKITVEKNTFFNITVDEWGEENIRTVEPLHEQEPDWLDAPAVVATPGWGPDRGVWVPKSGGHWKCACCQDERYWSDLHDVVPLYPKERAGSVAPLYPEGNRDE